MLHQNEQYQPMISQKQRMRNARCSELQVHANVRVYCPNARSSEGNRPNNCDVVEQLMEMPRRAMLEEVLGYLTYDMWQLRRT